MVIDWIVINVDLMMIDGDLPSGNLTKNWWENHHAINGKIH